MATAKIKDCFVLIQNGANIKQDKNSGGIPITRIETISNDRFNRDKMGYAGIDDASTYSRYILEDGDILMSHINSTKYLGRAVAYKKIGNETIIHGMNLLRLKVDRNKIIPDYAEYYFSFCGFKSKIASITKKAVNQASFSIRDLQELTIDLPDISEQKKISSRLKAIRKTIDIKRSQINRLDDLIKARFVEMFNKNFNNTVELGNVCDVRDGTHDSPKYHDEGYPLVTSKNICDGEIDFSTCSLIQKEDYDKINKRSKVDIGDVLMPMIGTVGNPIIVNIDKEFAIKNVALIKFKDDAVVLNSFIKALLESDYFDRVVLSKTKGGTQKFISLGDIRKLEFNLPPIELQNQFASFVAQVDKSKFALGNELTMGDFYIRLIYDRIMHGRIDL